MSRDLSTTVSQSTTAATSQTVSYVRTHTYGDPEIRYVLYKLVDRYTLTDRYGQTITQWQFLHDNITHEKTFSTQ